LLSLVAGLLMTGCVSSRTEAGCVTYNRYAPSVSPADTEETIKQVFELDIAMEAVCR
jgi:uncharacterized protein YceK